MKFWDRHQAEWALDMWTTTDVNGKMIDIQRSFQPKPKYWAILKLGFMAWAIQVLVMDAANFDVPSFWIVYLTSWGVCLTVLYHGLSFACMLFPISTDEPVNLLTKLTWGVFGTALDVEITVVVLYWTLEFSDQPITYYNIMKHGVLMLTLVFDGLFVNRIPLRFKQYYWFLLVATLYLIWTGIHAASGIGNPRNNDNDPETDDDAIYSVINWKKRPGGAAILCVLLYVVILPAVFLFTWLISTPGRLYVAGQTDGAQQNPREAAIEENDEEGP